MLKKNTLNYFTGGLAMDNNPLNVPNTVMTSALNATIVTRNGDENILLQDMGNGRVETAYLPEGFIPIGTVEFNGIIYVTSYNPLTNRSQIGSFPSPERNITSDELNESTNSIDNDSFVVLKEYTNACYSNDTDIVMTAVKASSIKLRILESEDGSRYMLNPGDRYKVFEDSYTASGEKTNALANNAETISDIYSTDPNIVDETPRYLTIHMISISEDGKINYLDENLKWDWNTSFTDPQFAYYINGDLERSADGSVDLDAYRSLVSSAYNVFNSKISGELALLFDVKTIDTFSATWDATISDIDDENDDKQANIVFYINYTSSSPRVNAKYIVATGSWLSRVGVDDPKSYNDKYNAFPFGSFVTLDTFDPKGKTEIIPDRKNDGTDDDIMIEAGDFKYPSDSILDIIWSYLLTPAMSFGNIDWLAINGSINFKLLGSGIIKLIEWRYYVSNAALTLSWGLEAYPEINKKIYSVQLLFYVVSNLCPCEDPDIDPNHIITVDSKSSYSGYFLNIIYFDNVTSLERDKLYLVKIVIKYGDDEEVTDRLFYRWLYTTGQWNNEYLSLDYTDFKECTLSTVDVFRAKLDVEDNINSLVTELLFAAPVPVIGTLAHSDLTYDMLGAKVTTVNYDWQSNKFTDSYGEAFKISVSIDSVNSLFTTTAKEIDVSLVSANITEDATIRHYAPSVLNDAVILPKVMGETYPDSLSGSTITGVTGDTQLLLKVIDEDGIPDSSSCDVAIDSFNVALNHDDGTNMFTLNVEGVIFSKINAEYSLTTCTPSSILRPMLLYQSDLSALNLLVLSNSTEDTDLVVLYDDSQFKYRRVDTDLSTLEFKEFYRIWTRQPTGTNFPIGAAKHDSSWELLPYDGATYSGYWDDPARQASKANSDNDKVDYWHLLKVKNKLGDFYNDYVVSALNKSSNALFQAIYYAGAWDTSLKHYLQISYIDKNKNWAEHMTFPLPVPAAVLSYAYGHDDARNLMKATCGFWVRTDSDEDPFMPIDFYVPMRMNEEGLFDPEYGTSSYAANRPHILAAVAASIYNCLYTVTNDLTELECNRATAINYLNPYTETWNINVDISAKLDSDNIYVDGLSVNDVKTCYKAYTGSELEDGMEDETNAGVLNISLGNNASTDLGVSTVSHSFTLNETDIYNIYEAYVKTHGVGAYANDCDANFMADDLDYAVTTSVYIRKGLSNTRLCTTMLVLTADTSNKIYLTLGMTMTTSGRIYATEQGCNMVKHTSRDLSMAKDAFATMKVGTNGRTVMFDSEELLKNTGYMWFCSHASEPGDDGDFDDEAMVVYRNPIMHLGYNNHEGSTDL